MGRLLERPMLAYRVLAPLLVVAFLVSGINGGDSVPDDGAVYYVSAGGWVVFCVALLVTVAFTLAVLVQLIRRRSAVD